MPYESSFYTPENIIGYTGVLNKNPTVYFLSRTHYGHITQVHDVWENVGRETVGLTKAYTFGNAGTPVCLYEQDTDLHMVHQSRSPMILVSAGAIPPELTHAIMVHPERKALRLRKDPVITRANLSRRDHPGQQPGDKERGAVRERLAFKWSLGENWGIPENSQLFQKLTNG